MNGWRVAFGAAKGYAKVSRSMNDSMRAGFDHHASQQIPRKVAKRGWLAPGDPIPPPGVDFLDYSGLTSSRSVMTAASSRMGPVLGGVIDLDSGLTHAPYRLEVEAFFQHLAVVAPPGKGKTYGVIAPLIVRLLRSGATVVALDVTGDLANQVKDFAGASSAGLRIPFFHWSTDESRGRHRWNPLAGVDPDDLTAIEGLKASILGEEAAAPEHRFFHDREMRILGGMLRLLLSESAEPRLDDLLALAMRRDILEQRLNSPRHASIRLELNDFLAADPSDAAMMTGELQTRLAPFVSPIVRKTVEASDFDLERLINQPSLLIVGAELSLRQRGEIAASLMINRLSSLLAERYSSRSGVPVVLMLDEAPVLARRINLASLLATSRATRTGVVLAAQNVTQFGNEDERSNIFDSCDTMMLLPGASDASIRTFQSRLGDREIARQSTMREYGKRRGSVSTSGQTVELLGARELMDPPFGQFPAFVHRRSDGFGPVPIELDRWATVSLDR